MNGECVFQLYLSTRFTIFAPSPYPAHPRTSVPHCHCHCTSHSATHRIDTTLSSHPQYTHPIAQYRLDDGMEDSMADAVSTAGSPNTSTVVPFPSLITYPTSPTSPLPAPAPSKPPPPPPPRKCDCIPLTGPETKTTSYQPGNACTRTGVWMTLHACGHTVRQFCLERSIERAPLIGLTHRQSWLAPCGCTTSWQLFCAGSRPPPPLPSPLPAAVAKKAARRGVGGGGGGGARAKKPTKKQLLQLAREQMPPPPLAEEGAAPDREPEDGEQGGDSSVAVAADPVRRGRKVLRPLKNAKGSTKKRPTAAKRVTRRK